MKSPAKADSKSIPACLIKTRVVLKYGTYGEVWVDGDCLIKTRVVLKWNTLDVERQRT